MKDFDAPVVAFFAILDCGYGGVAVLMWAYWP
jgi:hypothetical protein